MNRPPVAINVEGLVWNFDPGGNVEHLCREGHDVEWTDVEDILAGPHWFFPNETRPDRRASHFMLGADSKGRTLTVFLLETEEEGIWEPVTAHENRKYRQSLTDLMDEREARLRDEERETRDDQ